MAQGEEEIIIIGGGGTKPKMGFKASAASTETRREKHLRLMASAVDADPYEIARAKIDVAEERNLPVTFKARRGDK